MTHKNCSCPACDKAQHRRNVERWLAYMFMAAGTVLLGFVLYP